MLLHAIIQYTITVLAQILKEYGVILQKIFSNVRFFWRLAYVDFDLSTQTIDIMNINIHCLWRKHNRYRDALLLLREIRRSVAYNSGHVPRNTEVSLELRVSSFGFELLQTFYGRA